jgi:hypothetical protein
MYRIERVGARLSPPPVPLVTAVILVRCDSPSWCACACPPCCWLWWWCSASCTFLVASPLLCLPPLQLPPLPAPPLRLLTCAPLQCLRVRGSRRGRTRRRGPYDTIARPRRRLRRHLRRSPSPLCAHLRRRLRRWWAPEEPPEAIIPPPQAARKLKINDGTRIRARILPIIGRPGS